MYFIGFIAFVILAIVVARLSGRVSELEKKVGQGMPAVASGRPQAAPESPAPSQPWAASEEQPIKSYTPAASAERTEPSLGERFGAWIKEDWLLKLGAFIVLLGFAWLTTYAFMNDWIGPVGRIVLGVVAGSLLMCYGYVRMQKYVHQGGIFLVLGSATVILTLFAARAAYDFLSPTAALILMFLCASFVALSSVRYHTRGLAVVSLILAAFTPLMIAAPSTDYIGLFIYLLVVTIGTVWVVALRGWRELLFIALITISLYSMPYWLSSRLAADTGTVLALAYVFAALFFVVGTVGILRTKGRDRVPDLMVALGNGVFLLLWIFTAVPSEWQSLIIVAWMIAFAVGGFIVFRITHEPAPFLLYGGVAVGFLAAATAVELDGAALTIAYIFEAALVPLLTYWMVRDARLAEATSILLVGPVILSIGEPLRVLAGEEGDLAVLFCMALALLAVGSFFWMKKNESSEKLSGHPILIVAGLVYVYVIIWDLCHRGSSIDYVGTMTALVIYTIIGLASYFAGKRNNVRAVQLHGSIVLGFVAGRLLIFDVWSMEMAGKIVTFFLVGALLMTTAFASRKKNITQ